MNMIQQSFKPGEHLKKYIREYIIIDLEIDPRLRVPVKPYPANPEQGITFYAKGFVTSSDPVTSVFERRPKSVIFGQPLCMQNLQPTHRYLMLDVRFQPGMLFKFLKTPLTEFVHKNVDAELLLGREVSEINERLANAGDYKKMIIIIENYLWNKIRKIKEDNHPFENIARLIQDNNHIFSLDKLAKEACLSHSQFERKFKQQTGVTPKLFLRICRFYQAFRFKERKPLLDWKSIAWETGYCDYQHLVKDFKEFSGNTPNTLIMEYNQSVENWLGTGLTPNFV
jgi:AraC-like DNA-binding protein